MPAIFLPARSFISRHGAAGAGHIAGLIRRQAGALHQMPFMRAASPIIMTPRRQAPYADTGA